MMVTICLSVYSILNSPVQYWRKCSFSVVLARSIAFSLLPMSFIGCAEIPTEAISLNQQISRNISIAKDNTLVLIDAWEKSGHAQVDERWSEIYKKASSLYQRKSEEERSKLEANATTDQNVGELASLIAQAARSSISAKANAMRNSVVEIMQETLAANASVTRILSSASAVGQSRAYVIESVNDLLSIKLPSINNLILKSLEDNANGG